MIPEMQRKEELDHTMAQDATVVHLTNHREKQTLAEMAITHAVDFRRLLGTLECVEMYLTAGKVGEAKKIVDDGLAFYQDIASLRAKEISA